MPFEDLTFCGKNQVRKVVKRFAATHLLSLVDPNDRMPTPHRILRENHLSVCFDDVESPELSGAPTETDLEAIVAWVDRLPDSARLVIHCTAGVSRSAAVAFGLMCRGHDIELARDRLLETQPNASPNALVTTLMDRMFNMGGALHDAALQVRSLDKRRPLPEGKVI